MSPRRSRLRFRISLPPPNRSREPCDEFVQRLPIRACRHDLVVPPASAPPEAIEPLAAPTPNAADSAAERNRDRSREKGSGNPRQTSLFPSSRLISLHGSVGGVPRSRKRGVVARRAAPRNRTISQGRTSASRELSTTAHSQRRDQKWGIWPSWYARKVTPTIGTQQSEPKRSKTNEFLRTRSRPCGSHAFAHSAA